MTDGLCSQQPLSLSTPELSLKYDSAGLAKLSSSISAAGQIVVLGQGCRGFGGRPEVDGCSVSGWCWEIEGRRLRRW